MNTNRLLKIVPVSEMRGIEEATERNEGISSLELMERAAQAWTGCFIDRNKAERRVVVVCGPGNNGGDGLAIARMLYERGFDVCCRLYSLGNRLSAGNAANRDRLAASGAGLREISELRDEDLDFSDFSVIIDALFGAGLNRPLSGDYAEVVMAMNGSYCKIVSVDVPSGLFGEDNGANIREHIVAADETYTFQFPKLAFLFPENAFNVGQWKVLNINLNKDAAMAAGSDYFGLTEYFVRGALPKVRLFAHKGLHGRAALVAGHGNMVGAAIMAAMAAVRSGLGLLYAYFPGQGLSALMSRVPEAIPKIFNTYDDSFGELVEPDQYGAIAVGPGLGIKQSSAEGLERMIRNSSCRLVIDADALNVMADNPEMLEYVAGRAILTPHPREFERLAGKWADDYGRLCKVREFAAKYNVCVVLKDAYSVIALPDGKCVFNPTGNPGLAKGGSGDVLTGVLLALAALRIPLDIAAVLGVYVHGLAGDILADKYGIRGYSPSMVAENIGLAWKYLERSFVKPKW